MGLQSSNSVPVISRLFTEMKKLFRIAEIVLILGFLIWVSTRLPFAVRISGEYLRLLLNVVVSPLFIFLLGNLIVLTLFFNSGAHLVLFRQPRESFEEAHQLDFCRDLIADNCSDPAGESITGAPPASEEIVYQDKKTIFEVTKQQPLMPKVHRRTQSENILKSNNLKEEEPMASGQMLLRRSETERLRRLPAEEVEQMSNEEFQKAIEAFIAKQIKFHKEEKFAIVVPGLT